MTWGLAVLVVVCAVCGSLLVLSLSRTNQLGNCQRQNDVRVVTNAQIAAFNRFVDGKSVEKIHPLRIVDCDEAVPLIPGVG